MCSDLTPMTQGADFDPRDSSLFADRRQEAVFARLRGSDEFHVDRNGPVPVYSFVRYHDVERAYKEPDVFSPSAGLTLDAFEPGGAASLTRMLETAPPARHRALRTAMQPAFRGSALAAVRGDFERRLGGFLAAIEEGGVIEFVGAFAREAATSMMSELLGVPEEERERLLPALGAIGDIDFGCSAESVARRRQIEFRLLRELTRVVRAHRLANRRDGLIGALRAAQVDGLPLNDDDVALNCFNVAVAGTGASQHTLAGAVAVWTGQRASPGDVAADPSLRRRFVDETLRWLSPVVHLTRILTEDVEISGQRLPSGACVCLWNISANRDERAFEEADAFKPDRPPARNLAFGAGPQYCLGAEIVRAQLDGLLIGLSRRGIRFDLAGAPVAIPSNAIAGIESLPLRISISGR